MSTVVVTGPGPGLGPHALEVLGRGGYRVLEAGARRALDAVRAESPVAVIDCVGLTSEDEGLWERGESGALASAARAAGAHSVLLSSGGIFGRRAAAPFLESDRPSPTTTPARALLGCEQAVAAANPHHTIVRCSWPYGGAGGDFAAELLRDVRAGARPVEADDRQPCVPTYVPHLAVALLRVLRAPGYGIFHLTGGGTCSRLQFGRALLTASDLPVTLVPGSKGLKDWPELGSRRHPPLELPDWRLGVKGYVSRENRC